MGSVGPGLKALEDATTIRRRLLLAFERAERESDEAKRQALLTFAIVGGGPTGVELAGIIAELAKQTIWPEFRNIDTRQTRVMLLEAGPRVLAAFPEDLSNYALKALEKLGVEVRLGIPVKDITAEGVTVGEEFIPCRTAIWAAGVAASPAATWLNAESDRAGRVKVLSNLNVPGHEDIFVIGDTAWVEGPDGKPVPVLPLPPSSKVPMLPRSSKVALKERPHRCHSVISIRAILRPSAEAPLWLIWVASSLRG